MSIFSNFFIERRYHNLLDKAANLRYQFNALPSRESRLRTAIEDFNKNTKGWLVLQSFLPFTNAYKHRQATAKCLNELKGYVDSAPLTMQIMQRKSEETVFKRQSESMERLLKEKNAEIREIKLEVKGLQSIIKDQEKHLEILQDNLTKAKQAQAQAEASKTKSIIAFFRHKPKQKPMSRQHACSRHRQIKCKISTS